MHKSTNNLHNSMEIIEKAKKVFELRREIISGDTILVYLIYKSARGQEHGLLLGNVEKLESCFKAFDIAGNNRLSHKFYDNLKFPDKTEFSGYLFDKTQKNEDIILRAMSNFARNQDYPCGSQATFKLTKRGGTFTDTNNSVKDFSRDHSLAFMLGVMGSRGDFESYRIEVNNEFDNEYNVNELGREVAKDNFVKDFERVRNKDNIQITFTWGIKNVCNIVKGQYVPITEKPKRNTKTGLERFLEMQERAKEELESRTSTNTTYTSPDKPVNSYTFEKTILANSTNEEINYARDSKRSSSPKTRSLGGHNKRITVNNMLVPVLVEEQNSLEKMCTTVGGNTCGVKTMGTEPKPTTNCGLCGCKGHSRDMCVCPFCKLINAHVPKLCPYLDARFRSAEAINMKSDSSPGGIDPFSVINHDARFLINEGDNLVKTCAIVAVGQLDDMNILKKQLESENPRKKLVVLQNLYEYITKGLAHFEPSDMDGCISKKFRNQLKDIFNHRTETGKYSNFSRPLTEAQRRVQHIHDAPRKAARSRSPVNVVSEEDRRLFEEEDDYSSSRWRSESTTPQVVNYRRNTREDDDDYEDDQMTRSGRVVFSDVEDYDHGSSYRNKAFSSFTRQQSPRQFSSESARSGTSSSGASRSNFFLSLALSRKK